MLAGGKTKTEEKLAYSVWAVWQANGGHAETASSSADPSLNKENSFFYPGQASKIVKKCLSSPSQTMALYSGGVKVLWEIPYKNQEDCLQAVTSWSWDLGLDTSILGHPG